jgi:hypothetical protein
MDTPQLYFVKVLSAAVKVIRRAEDGTTSLLKHAGFNPADGSPILVPDTKTVILQKGEPLPENLADGEIDRLLSLDPPAIGRKAAVSVIESTRPSSSSSAGSVKVKQTAAKRPAAKKPAARKQAVKAKTDLGKLAELAEADLVKLITDEAPGVNKLLAAVGTDREVAQRLLAAETTATSGEPRKGLVEGLEKVIAAAAGGMEGDS